MSEITKGARQAVERDLDLLEMSNFNEGFEAAINALDEMSDREHNIGNTVTAEILRKAVKELLGENVDVN